MWSTMRYGSLFVSALAIVINYYYFFIITTVVYVYCQFLLTDQPI